MASGSGEGPGEAFIVTNVSDEYLIMQHLGLQVTMQSLKNADNHNYDVLYGVDREGSGSEVWFNIDQPFGTLDKMMGRDHQNTKKGKNRKKLKNPGRK